MTLTGVPHMPAQRRLVEFRRLSLRVPTHKFERLDERQFAGFGAASLQGEHVQTPRRQPPEHNQHTNRAEANQSNQPTADLQLSLLARNLSSSRSRTGSNVSAGDSLLDDCPLPPINRFRLRPYPYMRQAPLSIPTLAVGTRPARKSSVNSKLGLRLTDWSGPASADSRAALRWRRRRRAAHRPAHLRPGASWRHDGSGRASSRPVSVAAGHARGRVPTKRPRRRRPDRTDHALLRVRPAVRGRIGPRTSAKQCPSVGCGRRSRAGRARGERRGVASRRTRRLPHPWPRASTRSQRQRMPKDPYAAGTRRPVPRRGANPEPRLAVRKVRTLLLQSTQVRRPRQARQQPDRRGSPRHLLVRRRRGRLCAAYRQSQ